MTRSILVPLDGSSAAEGVLPHACRLARATGSRLLLMKVIPDHSAMYGRSLEFHLGMDWWGEGDEAHSHARGYLASLAVHMEMLGVHAATEILHGKPAQAINDYTAQTPEVTMIALCTHGQSRRRGIMGTVAAEVLSASRVPTLVVRSTGASGPAPSVHHPGHDEYRTILVPVDGSPGSERALKHAEQVEYYFYDPPYKIIGRRNEVVVRLPGFTEHT